MAYLCEKHRSQIQHQRINGNSLWQDLMSMGINSHQENRFEDATRFFGTAAEVATLTLEQSPLPEAPASPVEKLVNASHNQSASLCAQQQHTAAEKVLAELHGQVMSISLNPRHPRQLRIDALTNLEATLFSLSSHLGYQNKAKALHSIIEETERVAEQVKQMLFSPEMALTQVPGNASNDPGNSTSPFVAHC